MPKKHKKKVDEITSRLSKQSISSQPKPKGKTVLDDVIDPKLLAKWPKIKMKVPAVFLHQPIDFEQHVKKVLNKGIKFYQPHRGKLYTRINCETFHDHKLLTQYLDKNQLPYHTFGNPTKRKMKVVIRGLPNGLDLDKIKESFKSVFIPIVRLHKMKIGEGRRDNTMLVLAVVNNDDKGKTILRIKQVLGYEVVLEPPKDKPKQCYRCQKWGHSQRFCHGQIKCVKCAENHLSKKCKKTLDEDPKCVNCEEAHTASFRKCLHSRGPLDYSLMQFLGLITPCYKPRILVTEDNFTTLYKNVDYTKKSN